MSGVDQVGTRGLLTVWFRAASIIVQLVRLRITVITARIVLTLCMFLVITLTINSFSAPSTNITYIPLFLDNCGEFNRNTSVRHACWRRHLNIVSSFKPMFVVFTHYVDSCLGAVPDKCSAPNCNHERVCPGVLEIIAIARSVESNHE